MGNISVTRYPNGLTNNGESNIFADLVTMDPTKLHEYWDDFNTFTAGEWVITETNASATEATTSGDGGWLLITNTGANNDLAALQKTPSAFSFTAGKKAFFKARLKTDNATLAAWVMGLQVIDTTPLDVTDGIYFLKSAGAATIDFLCRKDASTGSNSASAIASAADDTFIEVAWYYDGVSKVQYAVNGTILGSLDASSTYLPDTITTVSFAVANGSAAARTMTVDYVYAAIER